MTSPGDEAGTYFERHQDYERRLREGSHRWTVPRAIELSMVWRQRIVTIAAVLSLTTSASLLAYLGYLGVDHHLYFFMYEIGKRHAIAAAVAIGVVLVATCLTFRMPLYIVYSESVVIGLIAIMFTILAAANVVTISSRRPLLSRSWDQASDEARAEVQGRQACVTRASCLDALVPFVQQDLTMLIAFGGVQALLLLSLAWNTTQLARRQSLSFRIL